MARTTKAAEVPISASASQLTLLETLDLILAAFAIFGSVIYNIVTGPFRGQDNCHKYLHHITHALARKCTERLSTAQLHYLNPSFSQVYRKWCKGKGYEPNIVTLDSGVKALWVGDPSSKYIVIYYHGGGFALDGDLGHLNFWGNDVYPDLKTANKSVAFLFLEYTLVPYGTYPTQFRQAVEAIKYVIKDLRRSPSEILLGGDSAGGNLCLAVLSHLLSPSPDVPELEIDQPLKGLILVAPWVRFTLNTPSERNNAKKDIVNVPTGKEWARTYLAGKDGGPYAEPLIADASWWKHASTKVESILCVAGSDEILLDVINEWVEKFKSANKSNNIEHVVGKNEAHIAPIVEPMLGDKSPTIQGEAIKSWMKARL